MGVDGLEVEVRGAVQARTGSGQRSDYREAMLFDDCLRSAEAVMVEQGVAAICNVFRHTDGVVRLVEDLVIIVGLRFGSGVWMV